MAHEAHETAHVPKFVLPVLVFGLPEVRRLRRELEALEEFVREAAVRTPGTQPSLPRLSRVCEALAAENHLNLLQPVDRKQLAVFLLSVEQAAPQLHISFAADPSSAFTAKIVTWLRTNIHHYALLQTGLQPTIAAGCVVRTTNKVFDFSLRERFIKTEKLLLEAFETQAAKKDDNTIPVEPVMTGATPVAPAVTAATPPPEPTVAQAAPVAAPAAAPEAPEPAVAIEPKPEQPPAPENTHDTQVTEQELAALADTGQAVPTPVPVAESASAIQADQQASATATPAAGTAQHHMDRTEEVEDLAELALVGAQIISDVLPPKEPR
jgi:F0F1-type ATP synthase delta subunit